VIEPALFYNSSRILWGEIFLYCLLSYGSANIGYTLMSHSETSDAVSQQVGDSKTKLSDAIVESCRISECTKQTIRCMEFCGLFRRRELLNSYYKVKVKFSPLQALEALRVVRG
jgi:hypothetical protein